MGWSWGQLWNKKKQLRESSQAHHQKVVQSSVTQKAVRCSMRAALASGFLAGCEPHNCVSLCVVLKNSCCPEAHAHRPPRDLPPGVDLERASYSNTRRTSGLAKCTKIEQLSHGMKEQKNPFPYKNIRKTLLQNRKKVMEPITIN
jgi:hypothetical protein